MTIKTDEQISLKIVHRVREIECLSACEGGICRTGKFKTRYTTTLAAAFTETQVISVYFVSMAIPVDKWAVKVR